MPAAEHPSADPLRARLAALGLGAPADVPEDPTIAPATAVEPAPRGAHRAEPPSPLAVALAERLPPWLRSSAGPSSAALAGLTAICLLCVAVTGWTLMHRSPAAAAAESAPLPAQTSLALPTPTATSIVVDVGGRVRRPGLVTLPAGARVADALRAAGGALRPRDLALLNLAARVTDGELLLVGVAGAGTQSSGGGGQSGPVNLNTATAEQLDALPGIGPVLAQHIIDWRTAHGGFRSVDQLRDVSGIGDSTFADLAPLVTV